MVDVALIVLLIILAGLAWRRYEQADEQVRRFETRWTWDDDT